MAENMAPESGNVSMTVNEAAGAFLGLMEPTEAEQAAPQAQEETEQAEASETEALETEEVEVEPEPQRFRVKAAGEEKEVTFDELVDGYQKGLDYTKKSQSLAEQRKAVEAERLAVEQAKQARDAYAQRLNLIEDFISKQDTGENLEALKEVDPIGYAVKVAERTEREKQLAMVQAERQRIAEQQNAERQAALAQAVQREAQRLTEVIPDYGHPEKGTEVKKMVREFAKSIGYSDQELASAYDSRAVQVLYMAAQYAKLQNQKPQVTKKVSEAPKMLRPGNAATQKVAADENIKNAHSRLRKTGKVSDAAALFERLL